MKYEATLLYAEDDKKLLAQYTKFFNTLFTKVVSAKDGEEAYQLYQKHQPDILVLDINMPKIDGLSLAQKIRESDTQTKIIILTAHSDKENLFKAIPLLLVNYLVKPIKTQQLLETLDTTVAQIETNTMLKINDTFSYDGKKHILIENGNLHIPLTKNEIKLIELLIQNPTKDIFEVDTIVNFVWDDLNYSMTRLRSLINRLQQKLQQKLFISHYGIGYKIIR